MKKLVTTGLVTQIPIMAISIARATVLAIFLLIVGTEWSTLAMVKLVMMAMPMTMTNVAITARVRVVVMVKCMRA